MAIQSQWFVPIIPINGNRGKFCANGSQNICKHISGSVRSPSGSQEFILIHHIPQEFHIYGAVDCCGGTGKSIFTLKFVTRNNFNFFAHQATALLSIPKTGSRDLAQREFESEMSCDESLNYFRTCALTSSASGTANVCKSELLLEIFLFSNAPMNEDNIIRLAIGIKCNFYSEAPYLADSLQNQICKRTIGAGHERVFHAFVGRYSKIWESLLSQTPKAQTPSYLKLMITVILSGLGKVCTTLSDKNSKLKEYCVVYERMGTWMLFVRHAVQQLKDRALSTDTNINSTKTSCVGASTESDMLFLALGKPTLLI